MADSENGRLGYMFVEDEDGITCRLKYSDMGGSGHRRTYVRINDAHGEHCDEEELSGNRVSEETARERIALARERWGAGEEPGYREVGLYKLRFVHDAAAENMGSDYFLGMVTGIRDALDSLGYEVELDDRARKIVSIREPV